MNNQTIARKGFDYNGLPDNATRATLRQEATAIKLAVKRTHDNIIEIGNRLIHAKDVAGHGKFMEWVDSEFQMEYRTAKRFMEVAEAFGKIDNLSNLTLPTSALYMLSAPSISEETRSVAVELAQSGDLKTTRDVKELIEIAKPIQTPQSEDDDDLGADPFADEDAPDSLADIAAIEAEDDAPVVDVPEREGEYFTDDAPVPPAKTPVTDTLKQRVKNAEVVHDTLADAPKLEEMSDEDWLDSLPIYRVLKLRGHRAIALRRDLLSMRELADALDKFEYQARRAFEFKNPTGTPAETRIIGAAAMPRPLDWQVCAPCKGNGCNRCTHAGYDVTGAGISPLRVESGEVQL